MRERGVVEFGLFVVCLFAHFVFSFLSFCSDVFKFLRVSDVHNCIYIPDVHNCIYIPYVHNCIYIPYVHNCI
jgi:hypothetical protein